MIKLNNDNRAFVLSEGLKKMQEIKAAPGSKLRQYRNNIILILFLIGLKEDSIRN